MAIGCGITPKAIVLSIHNLYHPSLSLSNPCGFGGLTLNLRSEILGQSKSAELG
ncbi:hypothetical protein [Nostoc sp. UIC 10630]|uniref:hypothetical protein n=1 Tax=Nostoc sp. UIC 10630 TaxID=2100146 RepID=UPI0013D0E1D5|nr:hypothetical protein [Nostoc sp. UIC 10630]NEU84379.1 hypothetical protein [Nostoc sp. UIC 10630]